MDRQALIRRLTGIVGPLDMLRTRNREAILVRACIEARQRFVVDNTNPTQADRARYVVPARAAGFTACRLRSSDFHLQPSWLHDDVFAVVATAGTTNLGLIDDLTGLAFGGNKTRNLEFRMAEAEDLKGPLVFLASNASSYDWRNRGRSSGCVRSCMRRPGSL